MLRMKQFLSTQDTPWIDIRDNAYDLNHNQLSNADFLSVQKHDFKGWWGGSITHTHLQGSATGEGRSYLQTEYNLIHRAEFKSKLFYLNNNA